MIKYHLANPNLRFERKSRGASGFDIMADHTTPRTIPCVKMDRDDDFMSREVIAPTRWQFSTGLRLAMPIGVEAQVRTRSGLGNHGVVVVHGIGTVDSDYRGEIFVTLINLGNRDYEILPGDRIAQIVFAPVICETDVECESFIRHDVVRVSCIADLGVTERGEGGYGSTGR